MFIRMIYGTIHADANIHWFSKNNKNQRLKTLKILSHDISSILMASTYEVSLIRIFSRILSISLRTYFLFCYSFACSDKISVFDYFFFTFYFCFHKHDRLSQINHWACLVNTERETESRWREPNQLIMICRINLHWNFTHDTFQKNWNSNNNDTRKNGKILNNLTCLSFVDGHHFLSLWSFVKISNQ